MIDVLPIVMLAALAVLLFSGLPVAVLLAGIGVLFSLIGVAIGEMPAAALYNIPLRMFGSIRGGLIFPAVVMLLFMGVALEKSGVARDMLLCLKMLLRRVPNGLAVAVILLGVLLAPAAGLVGASVVTLALIALPTMLAQGYRASVATGSVAAAGTVGIILPPAVMLFFLAGQFGVSIGHMLMATVVPGAILIGLYLAYYIISGMIRPPAAATEEDPYPATMRAWSGFIVRGLVMPFGLVALVLASIIFAWATPSQAGAVGAAGGVVLLILNRRLNWTIFLSVVQTTALLAAMVFFIIMAAAVFSYPFRYFGGDSVIAEALASLDFGPWGALLLIAGIIFILGFFIDWIEITVITLPLFMPVLIGLDFSSHAGEGPVAMLWMATIVALTLQTSFLTPPFGFALFFLKGAVPPGVGLGDIYRGIVPIVMAQIAGIALLLAFPKIATWLPLRIFE